jgi:type II secretion system protein G
MKFRANRKSGFTLVEVLIVVVIMAVLAATIIPQFSTSSNDAKVSTSRFNLNTIRAQLQMYKAQHNGNYPATLSLLTVATNAAGATGTGAALGPYLQTIPDEPFSAGNGVAVPNTVTAGTSPSTDTTFATGFGWMYNSATGQVWINSGYDPDGATGPLTALNAW